MRKNSLFMAGMLAVLLVFGLVLAGCSDGSGDGGGGGGPVTVKITNNSTKTVEFFVMVRSGNIVINTESKSIAADTTETITISYTDTTGKNFLPENLLLRAETLSGGNTYGNYNGSADLEVTFDGEKFDPAQRY
jgi:hypothetical protein